MTNTIRKPAHVYVYTSPFYNIHKRVCRFNIMSNGTYAAHVAATNDPHMLLNMTAQVSAHYHNSYLDCTMTPHNHLGSELAIYRTSCPSRIICMLFVDLMLQRFRVRCRNTMTLLGTRQPIMHDLRSRAAWLCPLTRGCVGYQASLHGTRN